MHGSKLSKELKYMSWINFTLQYLLPWMQHCQKQTWPKCYRLKNEFETCFELVRNWCIKWWGKKSRTTFLMSNNNQGQDLQKRIGANFDGKNNLRTLEIEVEVTRINLKCWDLSWNDTKKGHSVEKKWKYPTLMFTSNTWGKVSLNDSFQI